VVETKYLDEIKEADEEESYEPLTKN